MRIFSRLYERVLSWSGHPKAEWYLGALSFAESSFFPVPPDVLLAPMTLAKPAMGPRFALTTTMASVVGGVAGYLIGYFALEAITPWLIDLGYMDNYNTVRGWFETWGFWAVLAAGFSPIPYKLFTIAAGALAMFMPLFLLASLVGRGARFFLVAGLVMWGGPKVEQRLRTHIDTIGWTVVNVGPRFALTTTMASVVGGVAGYLIGYFALEAITPWLIDLGYMDNYNTVRGWFETWGFWAVLAAGFSPIPYKLFTIAAGALAMFMPLFLLASLVGRGARFFLVAGLVMWGGPKVEQRLRTHIDTIGWTVVILVAAGVLLYYR